MSISNSHCHHPRHFGWLLPAFLLSMSGISLAADAPMGVERLARLAYSGYQSGAPSDDTVRWVQIDLGVSKPIDKVKLFPDIDGDRNSHGFPVRFKLEASDDPEFKTTALILDHTGTDYPRPSDEVGVFPGNGASGRYVRLTAARLSEKKLSLTKFEVWSAGKDAAEGCPCSDSLKGDLGKIRLTRAPRPQGDEDVTDNPQNVIPANQWKPVPYHAQVPLTGVQLNGGLFETAMKNNITYLLNSFTVDEMVRNFRERAGKPNPPGMRPPDGFWDTCLPGSSAGRFMMGAGNTVRWIDDPELRKRMNQIIDIIAECREPNGYIMAYPANTIFFNERAAYTRAWVTHGMIEAGFAGNPKAFELLRGYYDWFDKNPYLPELLRRAGQGVQGMIANTRMYFTPLGKPEDLQVIQRYYQEDYWLDELANREDKAIWQYPYDHPHCYLITSIEPYLDLYRATGHQHYLDAAMGGWDLYHDNWEHVGGSIAICEGDSYPPKSYYLHRHTGELCGSVFWVRFNQRFHLLYPDQEKYVNEIEKSIYNVSLANQVGDKGIRYHAHLVGRKDNSSGIAKNTCCEGQGTRLLGSLPEYIYSLGKDGFYVNLYEPSTLTWQQGGKTLKAQTISQFPFKPNVKVQLSAAQPVQAKIRVRVPTWASSNMPILVNGKLAVTGKAGSYVTLDRKWSGGDTISFKLPMEFKVTQYRGAERARGQERYALEYGPILMAAVSTTGSQQEARLAFDASELVKRLKAQEDKPLHFAIDGDPDHEYLPYWQVQNEMFTCYPVIGNGITPEERPQKVDPGDLALASKGATATADGEYDQEKGCTAKVIDGIISTPADFTNRWHSSLDTPHPHWVQVKLPKVEKIGRIVIRFADPAGYPTSFQGIVRMNGKDKTLFDVKDYTDDRKYEVKFAPIETDTFRLVIRESANPAYPNAAQVSEIEIYPPAAIK